MEAARVRVKAGKIMVRWSRICENPDKSPQIPTIPTTGSAIS